MKYHLLIIGILINISNSYFVYKPLKLKSEEIGAFCDLDNYNNKQFKVKQAFLHAWSGYKTYAWGKDELRPLTNSSNERFQNWGATLVDSLTTLWLMDLKEEFREAVDEVKKVDFTKSKGKVNFFETTIRYLGGLIGAYDLSGEKALLDQAIKLADSLLIAFDSPTGFPYNDIIFPNKIADKSKNLILSEIGTCQLELVRLSQITKDSKYEKKAMKIIDRLDKLKKPQVGLYPVYLDPNTGDFVTQEVTFGSLGDSFYEYLIKLYMLTGKKDARLKRMYLESIEGFKSLTSNGKNGVTYFYRIDAVGGKQSIMDHVGLFMGGLLQYGDFVLNSNENSQLGLNITKVGFEFHKSSTKLAPETISFYESGTSTALWPKNYLRPEFIESLFYSWRFTKNKLYREKAWEIFEAIETYSKTPAGYATYENVNNKNIKTQQLDEMESFFMGETLKYLYLIFSPDSLLDFNEFVFNTEAHPIRITAN
jgi:mannosyl-oligosaccharide alpha-1,2-mannosidase